MPSACSLAQRSPGLQRKSPCKASGKSRHGHLSAQRPSLALTKAYSLPDRSRTRAQVPTPPSRYKGLPLTLPLVSPSPMKRVVPLLNPVPRPRTPSHFLSDACGSDTGRRYFLAPPRLLSLLLASPPRSPSHLQAFPVRPSPSGGTQTPLPPGWLPWPPPFPSGWVSCAPRARTRPPTTPFCVTRVAWAPTKPHAPPRSQDPLQTPSSTCSVTGPHPSPPLSLPDRARPEVPELAPRSLPGPCFTTALWLPDAGCPPPED